MVDGRVSEWFLFCLLDFSLVLGDFHFNIWVIHPYSVAATSCHPYERRTHIMLPRLRTIDLQWYYHVTPVENHWPTAILLCHPGWEPLAYSDIIMFSRCLLRAEFCRGINVNRPRKISTTRYVKKNFNQVLNAQITDRHTTANTIWFNVGAKRRFKEWLSAEPHLGHFTFSRVIRAPVEYLIFVIFSFSNTEIAYLLSDRSQANCVSFLNFLVFFFFATSYSILKTRA